MKWLMIAMLVLAGSVIVAVVALPDPGYVLIGYGKYSLETSLLLFVAMLALIYLGLRLLAGMWRVPANVKRWHTERRYRRLQQMFNQAVMELADGRLERAERRLGSLTHFADAPLDVFLSAARASNRIGQDQRRDASLKLALRRYPQAEVAIALVEAELQLSSSQFEQAQTTLTRLRELAPRNSQVLRLLMHLYLKQEDWQQLRDLLPVLRQGQVLDQEPWQQLAIQVYRESVLKPGIAQDLESLNGGWQQLPAPVQANEGLLSVYIEQLVRLGASDQAEKLLRNKIKGNWSSRFVYLYGELDSEDSTAQQTIAERWLEQHPDDPVLLLTLGKISLRNELWGKARNYLEASIAGQATPEAYRLLGLLLDRLEEPEQAAACYRKGIELVARTDSAMALTEGTGKELEPEKAIQVGSGT